MGIETPIRKILLEDWDPIGIKDERDAQSEYDSYAMVLVGMLFKAIDANEIANYLDTVVEVHMGLVPDKVVSMMVAKKLMDLNLSKTSKK